MFSAKENPINLSKSTARDRRPSSQIHHPIMNDNVLNLFQQRGTMVIICLVLLKI